MGLLICSALGRCVLAVLGPPGFCLSRGRPNLGLCPGAPCSGAFAVGFSLPAAQPPLHKAAAPALMSCSWSRAAPSTRSLFLCPRHRRLAAPRDPQPSPERATARAPQSCSWVMHVPCSPSGARCTLLGVQVSVSLPWSPRVSPPSCGPALNPCRPIPPWKIGAVPDSLGQSSPDPGALGLALARLLVGPVPLGCLLFLYFFFPSSYLDSCTNFFSL